MSEIVEVKNPLSLPDVEDLESLCFSCSADDMVERIKDWREHGENGSELSGKAALCLSLKYVLERKHPYKTNFKAKDWGTLSAEYDECMTLKETDYFNRSKYPFRELLKSRMKHRIQRWLPYLMTKALREYAVRQHAFGNSTVNIVKALLSPADKFPNAFFHIVDYFDYLEETVVKWLVPRLAYLKITSSSFPKKYAELWEQSRSEYLDSIKSIPLTETPEQVKALSELYARLEEAFEGAQTERGKSLIANSMVRVMSGLFTLTADPRFKNH